MKELISKYTIKLLKFKNIHSSGTELPFSNPCIGYLKKGSGKFLYKGKAYYAYEGDLIYIGMDTRYYSVWYGTPDIEFYSLNFEFLSRHAYYDYRFQIIRNYPSELFDKMYESYKEKPLSSVSCLFNMLNDIYSKMEIQENSARYTIIDPAIEYIEKNFSDKISITTLAKICNCSESTVFKLFNSTVGVSPIAYKHNVMIQHSLDLLAHTDLSIEEISDKSGFSSSNYFRKIFYKYTGKTPKELRK